MKNSWLLCLACFFIYVTNSYGLFDTSKLKKLVNGRGYPFENHKVYTEDGYILEMHRVPGGNYKNKTLADFKGPRPAVLINHGLADSSSAFLFAAANQSLAYILADNGYDVWLGNHRGNTFSRSHRRLLSFGFKFWNYSFHEIGLYDTPAMVDFVLKKTNQNRLFHVCHAEGCTELFVMTSMRPEYNDKIKLSVNLSPTILFGNSPIILRSIFQFTYLLQGVFSRIGYIKVLDKNFIYNILTSLFCKSGSPLQYICYGAISAIYGFDWFATNSSLLSQYLEVFPAGASIKEVIHFGFLHFYPGTFRQFDYGDCRNREIYNSSMPTEYPLSKSTLPVIIFYPTNDNMATVKDVQNFSKMIPNVIRGIYLENFNHLGYFLRPEAKNLVYDRIVQFFT